jgi:hypothetical protein
MRRAAIFGLFLWQLIAVARAQSVDVLRVNISPVKMSADGTGAPTLHWRLESLPTDSDILLTDPDRRLQLSQAIDSFAKIRTHCVGIFFTDHSNVPNNCSLSDALPGMVRFVSPGNLYLVAPTARTPTSGVTVVLRGIWTVASPPVIDSLCIVAATGSYNPGNCTENDPSATTVKLSTLAQTNNLGALPSQLADISIRVHDEHGSAAATVPLQKVAVDAFRIALQANAVPGHLFTAQAAAGVTSAIGSAYAIADSKWPAPEVVFGTAQVGPGYMLTIQNLHIVGSAAIMLNQGTQIGPQTPGINLALAKRRHEVGCALEKQYQRDLAPVVGAIPTSDDAWRVAKVILKSDQLVGPVIPQPASKNYTPCPGAPATPTGDRMEFTANRREVIAALNATIDAGIQASPHELLTGTGKLSENNMLLKNSETWADTGSLNLNGGPEVQTANASFGVGRSVGTQQTLAFGIDTDMLFLRDQNQRYGYLAGPTFVDEEHGANPNVYLTWTRPASLYALSAVVKASLGEQFRRVSLDPPAAYPPFLNHGWVNGLDPTFSAVSGYDFTHAHPTATGGGIGQIFVSVAGGFLAARDTAGGSFNFNRYSLKGEAELFFGVTGTSDFLVRYGRGVSATSAGTPLFELPQIGGSDNIRGIEQGEYVGRGLGFDQSELAVNAVSLWEWVRHTRATLPAKPDPAKTPAASNTSLSSLGITGIFVGGIYDRARIGSGSAASSLLDLSHGFHGSGIEAEVRGLRAGSSLVNIAFTYSISPNSVLHQKGVFLTSVSLNF